jgi:O-antigen ligase
MSTLATPSAKSHERVSGRWLRNIQVKTRRDWLAYHAKIIVGTPIPYLMFIFVAFAFVTRAGVEMASWAMALLSLIYIVIDHRGQSREFTFFRIGADFFLLGFLLTTLGAALISDSFAEGLATFGTARWVILLYLFAYTWELFPGINRIYYALIGAASLVSIYGIWQHFSGLDLVRGAALANAPVGPYAYFTITGFFDSPTVFGTLIATVLPFPAASFLLSERRAFDKIRWIGVGLFLLMALAIFWTYQPGLWLAALTGLAVTLVMQGRHRILFIASAAVLFACTITFSYSSSDKVFSEIQRSDDIRAQHQRDQINFQVKTWQENPIVGVGAKASSQEGYDPGTGNVYFQILAQTGLIGLVLYLLFILSFLLSTYRIFQEIPTTHQWHRVFVSGILGSQVAFHVAGLYWSTITESRVMNVFVFLLASMSYLSEHYSRGLVPDDHSL